MTELLLNPYLLSGVLLGFGVAFMLAAMAFRRVVATNEVHIVQSAKETKSFGKDTKMATHIMNGRHGFQLSVLLKSCYL